MLDRKVATVILLDKIIYYGKIMVASHSFIAYFQAHLTSIPVRLELVVYPWLWKGHLRLRLTSKTRKMVLVKWLIPVRSQVSWYRYLCTINGWSHVKYECYILRSSFYQLVCMCIYIYIYIYICLLILAMRKPVIDIWVLENRFYNQQYQISY